ncbi:hypothetical protein OPKNFCMD_1795 [Methylobacterium crusticola]|uniref:Uncharacterized protein n=1 Tax=Methylobacterium crusticola TaxID=1697972 RepID=A0ABQ4QUQ5_9HYPH|nr:hypothetical protein OPKNFCMD_1795 [Methylobacterium crusticola]
MLDGGDGRIGQFAQSRVDLVLNDGLSLRCRSQAHKAWTKLVRQRQQPLAR